MADVPFDVALERADAAIRAGFDVYQKFTCAHCGSRQTIDNPNKFHRSATCEECKKLTNITKCGFMGMKGVPR